MEAKVYLGQLEKLEVMINNKLIEKEQWRDLALNIVSNLDGERVQSSGNKSRMATAIEKCILVEEEIDILVDRLIDMKREVIATIEKLDKAAEYRVIHAKYIQNKELEEIAEDMNTSYTNITTLHGRALKSLQGVLDGKKGEH